MNATIHTAAATSARRRNVRLRAASAPIRKSTSPATPEVQGYISTGSVTHARPAASAIFGSNGVPAG